MDFKAYFESTNPKCLKKIQINIQLNVLSKEKFELIDPNSL